MVYRQLGGDQRWTPNAIYYCSLWLFETASHRTVSQLIELIFQTLSPRILLSPHPWHWDYKYVLPHLPFTGELEIWTLAAMISRDAVNCRAISPVSKSHFQLEDVQMFGWCPKESRQLSPTHLFLGHRYEVSVSKINVLSGAGKTPRLNKQEQWEVRLE